MRVAILHDYLNQFGGAERVLKTLLEIFPKADIFTLLYDKERTFGLFDKNIKKTSFLDFDFVKKRHRLFIPLMPFAAEFFKNQEEYDLVISSSAGYGKGIKIKGQYHICYCHSPLRYAWEIDYLKDVPVSPWLLSREISKPIAEWLRNWDRNASKKVNLFIANSEFISEKIRSYYGRESYVLYPPVDLETFYPETGQKQNNYFLMVGRLIYYKRFDLIIEAFNLIKKPLKIVGLGPEINKLKAMVRSPYIEFIPKVDDDKLRQIYTNAEALLFPQIEDFGLVAAEAQACGLPVIAFNRGGAREIIEDRKTGLFFNEQTVESVIDRIKEFEIMRFDRNKIRQNAMKFSKENFKNDFLKILNNSGFKN